MKRIWYYFRFQLQLLLALFVLLAPLTYLCREIIGMRMTPTQVLLFAVLVFIRISFEKFNFDFLHIDLRAYVEKKLGRIPSKAEMVQWDRLYREGQDAMFILAGFCIIVLRLFI